MAQYLLDNCCFCVDLRLGCLIIGYIELIGSIAGVIMASIDIANLSYLLLNGSKMMRDAATALLGVSAFTLIVVCILLTFAIVLIVGLHKNKPGHVKAYLIYNFIYIMLSVILLIVNFVTGPYVAIAIVSRILGILFSIYFLMVIRSYYYKMKHEPAANVHYS